MTASNATQQNFRSLVASSRPDRSRVADLIKAGQWRHAEDDEARGRAFDQRMKRVGAEAHHGKTVDFLPTPFLDQGAIVGRAVGKIVVTWGGATEEGTGVLVAPGVVITNQHVLRSAQAARGGTIELDFEDDPRPSRRAPTVYVLDPEKGFVSSPEIDGLDYALVAIGARKLGPGTLEATPTCPLMASADRHRVGMPVNIIQHPGGRHRVVALRENRLLHRASRALLYETDTEPGSSGAPVFNDHWEMIALHHYGEPLLALEDGVTLSNPTLNEGIRISAIVADLRERLQAAREQGGNPSLVALIERVLAHGEASAAALPVKRLQPRPPGMDAESARGTPALFVDEEPAMRELRLTLPEETTDLSLSLRLASAPTVATSPAQVQRAASPQPAIRQLVPGAERQRIDRNYANRTGFDEQFLDGMPIDLAAIVARRRSRIAPLLEGDTGGILHYQHFSVVMHRSRRLPMLTATNIDGPTYLSIDRTTGEISPLGAEGETWYTDPRIADEYLVTQAWYSDWSMYFDRGHLTRRNDPTWGEEAEARRAEKDTFHFTNCSPQHWSFNQSARHWQGIERYVLENGVHRTLSRLSVLQGPIFSTADWIADELLIPAQFWKLLAWMGGDGEARAVAFVASQQELLNLPRGSRPDAPSGPPEVGEFQVAIPELQRMTSLDLSVFEPWDTYGALPTAGEALRPIRAWTDLKLARPPA